MTDLQLVETSKLIQQEFYFLKPCDFRIFFDMMKSGDFGTIYDRMDGNVICVALRQYVEQRINTAEVMSYELAKEIKALENPAEKYFVMVHGKYIRESEDVYNFEDRKELATKYTWSHAIGLKGYIAAEMKATAKIIFSDKPEIGLIDYITQHKPEMKKDFHQNTQTQAGKSYTEKCKEIMNDSSLSEIEKSNKVRELAGVAPLTEDEISQRNVVLSRPKSSIK